jgi:uncharacterized membrane protein
MGDFIDELFALIFALAVVWFVWALVMYFFELSSEEGKRHLKPMVVNGASTLLLLMVLWALIEWIRGALGL